MTACLKQLLDRLDAIGREHEELFDSDVRQDMSNAILDGFVRRLPNYTVPQEFGMFSAEANSKVHAAIADFIVDAKTYAENCRPNTFHSRLSVVQDNSVLSVAGNDYDEFLGHSPPECFDANGEVIQE